jgi:hypothetical protein
MKELKNLKIVLLVLLVVFVLVILRTTGKNRFKQDAKNVIETVKSNKYSVSEKELNGNESQYLIVDLNNNATPGQKQFNGSTQIPFDKLLEESSLLKLQQTDNKILLTSDNNSLAIKAWVILNQMEFKNVFVFSNEENPEVLKYEFQPDTLVRLESVSE